MSENLIDLNSTSSYDDFLNSSLQILNGSALRDSFSCRDSLPFFNSVEVEDCGRESLGILQMNLLNTSSLDCPIASNKSAGTLDLAFLNHVSPQLDNNKLSVGSNISSYSSVFPSNTSDLDVSMISKIYSVNQHMTDSTDYFNEAFCFSSKLPLSFINATKHLKGKYSALEAFRVRIQSLPEPLKSKMSPLQEVGIARTVNEPKRKCHSVQNNVEAIKVLRKLRRSFSENTSLKLEEINGTDEFNDSVFIEANHIASKIADGSIWEENPENVNLLDSTPQPEWDCEEINDNDADTNIKSSEEDVFKKVDKMLQPLVPIEAVAETFVFEEKNVLQDNCCTVLSDNRLSCSKNSDTSQKSNDAKEILQNLTYILNATNRSDQQKSEGLTLLTSLADILNQKQHLSNLDDSGHSSIDALAPEQECECFEVLDLRTKNTNSDENVNVVDLSMKSKTENNRRLSQSFSFPAPKLVYSPLKRINKGTSSVPSLDMSKSKSSSNGFVNVSAENKTIDSGRFLSKLKPKRVEDKPSKGPLKAIIPVGSMAKALANKNQSSLKSAIARKTTSTPVHKSKLKPMAQSTPECNQEGQSRVMNSGLSIRAKFECPVSPLARPKSVNDMGYKTSFNSSRSDSAPDLSAQTSGSSKNSTPPVSLQGSVVNRRKSAGDLKLSNRVPLKRNYSTGRGSAVMSSAVKGKENLSTSNVVKKCVGKLPERSVRSGSALKENHRNVSGIKPFNLLSKIHKGASTEKENFKK